ncbi:MAG TPA: hypothetical protein ENF18_08940 [candidate division WOR-3 bacterium]|uniref:YncE family protein n=1 Tax=candidate division WOR-3 bacterium TaxID=2052148 RepID=A0A7C0VEP5_UNCW3|nr:hypothetical protein [candidate division WOR-3 bacterium]
MQMGKFFAVAIVIIFAGCAGGYYPDFIFEVSPEVIGTYDIPPFPWDIYVSGEYVYVANCVHGLRVIDVSNPFAPYEVACLKDGFVPIRITVAGKYAYIVDLSGGLDVIDISDPTNPSYYAPFCIPGFTIDVYCKNKNAYVIANGDFDDDGRRDDGRLYILDISNSQYTFILGQYDFPGRAWRVCVSGKYAYVTNEKEGLTIINVSNPHYPRKMSSFQTDGDAGNIFLQGDYAYVISNKSNHNVILNVINVSNPSQPKRVGHLDMEDTDCFITGIYVSGNYAFLADTSKGLVVIDISTPVFPRYVTSLPLSGRIECVFFQNNMVYAGSTLDMDGDGYEDTGRIYVIDIFQPTF